MNAKEAIERNVLLEFLSYCGLGILTNGLNMVSYYLLYDKLGVNNTLSTFIAWFLAVSLGFVTSKFCVFFSESREGKQVAKEMSGFVAVRLSTGVFDIVFMYLMVDLLGLPAVILKFISNLLVGLLNYLGSKLLVFRKKKKEPQD